MPGLILGTWVAGLDCQVHGYSVLWPEQEAMRGLERLLGTLAANTSPRQAPGRATASTDPSPRRSGVSTRAGQRPGQARRPLRRNLLDSTCTAKAMAGLLQGIAADTYRRGDRVVFHTPAGSAACSPELAPQTCATRH